MNYSKQLRQYKKTHVETAGGIDLVIMCYEQAIHALKQSKDYYIKKNFIKKGKSLQKAMDIIYELQCALDFDKGGQIAKNLDAIYNYITRTLLEADLKGKLEVFDEAVKILTELKEAWENIASKDSLGSNNTIYTETKENIKTQTTIAA